MPITQSTPNVIKSNVLQGSPLLVTAGSPVNFSNLQFVKNGTINGRNTYFNDDLNDRVTISYTGTNWKIEEVDDDTGAIRIVNASAGSQTYPWQATWPAGTSFVFGTPVANTNSFFGTAESDPQTGGISWIGENTAIGYNTLVNLVSDPSQRAGVADRWQARSNTALGSKALSESTEGSFNTALGADALILNSQFVQNSTALGYNAQITASNQVRLGNTFVTAVTSQVGNLSDERDKAEIRNTILGLDFIKQLRPVDWKWDFREDYREKAPVRPSSDATEEEKEAYKLAHAKWLEDSKLANITNDGTHKRTRFHHGLIAQEIKSLIETTGVDFGGFQDHTIKGGDECMTIGYTELIGPMIKAIQELSAEVASLKAQLNP
jgi:hypothetical protein